MTQEGVATAPTLAGDRTGLLIIRAWVEDGSSKPLRAQIRLSSDISAGIKRTVTLADADAVCTTVRQWLGELLDEPEQ